MGIASDLRESVLLAAMQGELSNQNLFEQPTLESSSNFEEYDYRIPDNWSIVRFSDVCFLYTGNSISAEVKTKKYTGLSNGYNYIGTKDVDFNHSVAYNNGIKIPFNEPKFKIAHKNTTLLCIEGGSAGRKMAIVSEDVCFGNKLCAFESNGNIEYKFVYYILMSPIFQTVFSTSISGIIGGVSIQKLQSILIPLPPLSEQKRIVDKLEVLMKEIDELEKIEEELSKLKEEFQTDIKASILQAAIQGKLVPQIPEEGTGEELYKEIQSEKAKLIKEGKIKKEKQLEDISEDEIPLDIPENWTWTSLKNICVKIVDGDHNPPKGESFKTDYIMVSSTNINNDTLVELEKVRYLSKEIYEQENLRTHAEKGDIFLTSVGSLGRSCVYNGEYNICFQRSVSVLKTLIYNYYLKTVFDSPFFQNIINSEATGTAQKGFYLNQLSECLIPIPPFAEQKRIVAKLEQLLPLCDNLS